jgi:hypothetical protein
MLNGIQTSWGFTNDTDATHEIAPKLIDMAHHYACRDSFTNGVRMYNATVPGETTEIITYQGDSLSMVKQTKPNLYPPKVQKGRSFNVTDEVKKIVTSSDDPTFRVDYPINCSISFRFTESPYVTKEDLLMVLCRTVGALFDSDDSGNSRIDNLMVGQYNPNL